MMSAAKIVKAGILFHKLRFSLKINLFKEKLKKIIKND